MHHLIAHTIEHVLEKYHTVGLFAEDGLELIQALVNRLCQQFIQINGNQKKQQILWSLQFQKQDICLKMSKAIKDEKKESRGFPDQNKEREKLIENNKVTPMLAKMMEEHTI